MNIKELLEEDGFSCKKMGNHGGGVYGSPCPWCGGDDRFRCWPHAENKGNYFCQKCGQKGIAVRYLVEYRGMEYAEACTFLGYTPSHSRGGLRNKKLYSVERWIPKEPDPIPSPQWQSQANSLISDAVNNLWDHQPSILEWLHQRGLTDGTIRNIKLGWNATDQWHERESWDLPAEINENGQPKKLWIPAGLVIPYESGGNVIRIRIRNTQGATFQKYYLLQGSSNNPTIVGTLPGVILVESDLDAFLINQEAGDLVTVIALGSANMRPDKFTTDLLRRSNIILNALDCDSAGIKSFWTWWKSYFPASIRWPVPFGKDPTDAYQQGLCIRDWIIAGLSSAKLSENKKIPQIENVVSARIIVFDNYEKAIRKLELLKKSGPIIIHLHITGQDPFTDKITAIQIYGKPEISLSLDPDTLREDARALLSQLLANNSRKIFHDAKPQLKLMLAAGLKVKGPYFDTMLAAQVLNAGIKGQNYDLQSLSNLYLEGMFPCPIETIKNLINVIVSKLNTENLSDTAELEFSCLPAVIEMEMNGMHLDSEKWNTLGNELAVKKHRFEKALQAELGGINPDNPKEIYAVLNSMDIAVPDTKRQTLMTYEDEYPILKQIIEYRKSAKLIQAFIVPIPKFINDKTGRIHAECHQLGASTGRFSCRKPNLQQIPRDKPFRSCVAASPGFRLLIADYSQIELRIAAEITGDATMIKAYHNGQDLHKMTASIITRKYLHQISKQERQAAKAVNFGLIYAMGADGLMAYAQNTYGVNLTVYQAQNFIDRFFGAYQGIAKWHNETRESLSRETRTLGNRRRLWNDIAPLTEILNSPIQGTSADILKRALSYLTDALLGTDSKIIACVHDEIILETKTENAKAVSDILVHTMITAGEYYLKSVPTDVDVIISENWADK